MHCSVYEHVLLYPIELSISEAIKLMTGGPLLFSQHNRILDNPLGRDGRLEDCKIQTNIRPSSKLIFVAHIRPSTDLNIPSKS